MKDTPENDERNKKNCIASEATMNEIGRKGTETADILEKLKNRKSLTEILDENKAMFSNMSIGEYISAEITRKNFTKAKIIKASGINKRFFFDILSGKKSPNRRYIIRIFLALQLDFNDVQWYLRATDYPQLYARNKRDAVIIYCINKKLSVDACNKMLNNIGLENLGFEGAGE